MISDPANTGEALVPGTDEKRMKVFAARSYFIWF